VSAKAILDKHSLEQLKIELADIDSALKNIDTCSKKEASQ